MNGEDPIQKAIESNFVSEKDRNRQTSSVEQEIYQIRVKGHLDRQWSEWFGGLSIAHKEDGTTVLTGPVPDQAALHGLLVKIRNLGLPLVSVNRVEPDCDGQPKLTKEKSME